MKALFNNKIFQSEFTDGKHIRVFGTFDQPLFVAKDIAEILGYSNTTEAIRKHVDEEDKISFKEALQLNKLIQNKLQSQTILINLRGVMTLLTYSKKNNDKLLRWFKDNFNINYSLIKRLSKEEEYISIIMKIFDGEIMTRQYKIDKYKVDLYFSKYNLIIECDEHGHQDRDFIYEKERTKLIENKLRSTFIRFNPDETSFDFFKVINQIFKYIKEYKPVSESETTKIST